MSLLLATSFELDIGAEQRIIPALVCCRRVFQVCSPRLMSVAHLQLPVLQIAMRSSTFKWSKDVALTGSAITDRVVVGVFQNIVHGQLKNVDFANCSEISTETVLLMCRIPTIVQAGFRLCTKIDAAAQATLIQQHPNEDLCRFAAQGWLNDLISGSRAASSNLAAAIPILRSALLTKTSCRDASTWHAMLALLGFVASLMVDDEDTCPHDLVPFSLVEDFLDSVDENLQIAAAVYLSRRVVRGLPNFAFAETLATRTNVLTILLRILLDRGCESRRTPLAMHCSTVLLCMRRSFPTPAVMSLVEKTLDLDQCADAEWDSFAVTFLEQFANVVCNGAVAVRHYFDRMAKMFYERWPKFTRSLFVRLLDPARFSAPRVVAARGGRPSQLPRKIIDLFGLAKSRDGFDFLITNVRVHLLLATFAVGSQAREDVDLLITVIHSLQRLPSRGESSEEALRVLAADRGELDNIFSTQIQDASIRAVFLRALTNLLEPKSTAYQSDDDDDDDDDDAADCSALADAF